MIDLWRTDGRDGKGITLFCVTVREVGASGGGRETPKAHNMQCTSWQVFWRLLPFYLCIMEVGWDQCRLSFRTPYPDMYLCVVIDYKA